MSRFGAIPVEQEGGSRFGAQSVEQQGIRGFTPMQFEGRPQDRALSYVPAEGSPQSRFLRGVIEARKAGDREAERILQDELRFADQQAFDPAADMGGARQLAAGAGASLARTGRGIGQLVGLASEEDEARARELEAPLMESGLGFTGNILGGVGQVVAPGAVLRGAAAVPQLSQAAPVLTGASRAFLPTTVAGSAASGAALGGLQPVAGPGERFRNVLIGGAAGGGGAAIPRVASGIRNAASSITGAERAAAGIIREAVPNAEAVVASAVPSRVPGVQRTLAEATLDPNVVNLDRAYRSTAGTRLTERELANNQARVDQLMRIAGDESQLDQAIALRDATSAPLRRQALKAENVDITKALDRLGKAEQALEGNPSIQSAIARVRGLLANANKPGGANMRELYNIRKEIGFMLSGQAGGENAQAIRQSRELMIARDAIDNVVSRRVPEFKRYLDTYKQLSGDVNRLQFGQELARVALGNAEGITPTLQPGAFMRATQGIDSTSPRAGANRLAATATGFRKAKAGDILPQADADTIRAIREDVSRMQEVARIASRNAGGNSQTALMQELQRGMVRRLSGLVPFLRDALDTLDDRAKERLSAAVADALADPNKARAILARFPAKDQRVVRETFAALGIGGGAVQAGGQKGSQGQGNNAGQ